MSQEKKNQNKTAEEEEEINNYGTSILPYNTQWTQLENQEKQRLKILLDSFNEDQMRRYEIFRRANIDKLSLRKMVNCILNQSITPNICIVISGFVKVFIGEIVEKALDIQKKWGHSGPLAPEHLREAYRLYKQETKRIPQNRTIRRLFR
ncbi:hypothetical protein T552_00936 [Pneumocystis carinii B80]|uniref:Transcription initiation factor TFIID subunit 11 n=1 Tax=Pneumocystis carinii (strain B80) TaxID=1408658 RepID=A0A0W4ZN00_PNEC8|nr:hypothetical protein T552_00936 [Pneumocystis carinii B80]KTW29729.1 hypothetical protein T552_00936 [Pneumocystis carinii B80]